MGMYSSVNWCKLKHTYISLNAWRKLLKAYELGRKLGIMFQLVKIGWLEYI